MKDLESLISPFIQSQFPEFYESEGPRFIDFVQQYYSWMEQQNQAVGAARSLFRIRDIDTTYDEFVVHFKEKYLLGLPLTLSANTRTLTKFAKDLYLEKGTAASVEMVLQGLFNVESKVHYPREDLFKTSAGVWYTPVYLELSPAQRTQNYVGKEIVGSQSQAKAFLESVVRRRVQGKYLDVAYLSNLRGNFVTGDIVTESANTILQNAPKVVGSLSSLTITTGGADLTVGQLFDITSPNGKQGVARVASISNQTGKVVFIFESALESGGWGYSSSPDVLVSSKVLTVGNQVNANNLITQFEKFEDIKQTLSVITYDTATPNNSGFVIGSVLENYAANNDVVANAIVVATAKANTTAGILTISPQTGNLTSIDTTFSLRGNTTTAVITNYTDTIITGNVFGSNTSSVVVSVNALTAVSNTNKTITSTNHPFSNNNLVRYTAKFGNTAIGGLSNNSLYYIANTDTSTFELANSYSGNAISITSGSSEEGHTFTFGSGYVGVGNIVGGVFISTPYANIVGVVSNTTASISNTSTGTGATFRIGQITDTESVFLTPDFLRMKNTANAIMHTVRLNGYNANTDLFSPARDLSFDTSGISTANISFNGSTDVSNTTDFITPSGGFSNLISNGQYIQYITATGNTAVTGIANAGFYYIVQANTTAFQLSTTNGGSTINLTSVSTSESGHHVRPVAEIAYRGLGFPKFPSASMDSILLDCFRYDAVEIGSIAGLVSINPGNDYNINPFVAVVEPYVAGYGYRDYVMLATVLTGAFVEGETIQQTFNTPATILTVSGFSGLGANGSVTTTFNQGEYVYQLYANSAVRAAGFVAEAAVSAGAGTAKLRNVTGVFVTTSNNSTIIRALTSNATSNASAVQITTSTTTARAIIKEVQQQTFANSTPYTLLYLKRINLENTFEENATIVGRTTGSTATVLQIDLDQTSEQIGLNANIPTIVQTANGVATAMDVQDSGFGFIDQETITLTSPGSNYQITAIVNLGKQGVGSGFYLSTGGFLSSDKRLHDGDYYQDFSYDIETSIPFASYFEVLHKIAHVAGTKAFGSVSTLSIIDTPLSISGVVGLIDDTTGLPGRQFTGGYTGTYVGDFHPYTGAYSTYTGTYVGDHFTGVYTIPFTGGYGTTIFTGNFSPAFSGAYTLGYSRNYTTLYTGSYQGEYTSAFAALYTRAFSHTYTSVYTSVYAGGFTQTQSYTQQYTAIFTGVYNTFTGNYTKNVYTGSTGAYTRNISFTSDSFTGVYNSFTGGYTKTFIGYFTKSFTHSFEGSYVSSFVGVYSKTYAMPFTSAYTGGFTSVYAGYTGAYSSIYTHAFASLYTAAYTGAYGSYSSAYTRSYQGSYTGTRVANFTQNYTIAVYTGTYVV